MNRKNEYNLARYACYSSNIALAVVSSMSPLLFVTFREVYGISYTLLGLLAVVCFSTQLLIDLIFTFFTKLFPIHKTVRMMPMFTFCGLLIYGILPAIFPQAAYVWIVIGTIIFSVAAGLNEVLASPVIAAIPSDNPEREMSKLHSMYAWGVVGIVIFSTLFLKAVGRENWYWLPMLLSVIPLTAFILFAKAKLPPMELGGDAVKKEKLFGPGLAICFVCLFLGGAAECTMTLWASSFAESALGVPKVLGDIIGMAVFAALLGLGRSLYAKYGNKILNVMLAGMLGASLCYATASLSLNPVIGLISCMATGFCVSMLWPGTLIFVGEKFPSAGVAVYALMAAGGDMGASVAPQLVGIFSDTIGASAFAADLAQKLCISAEQVGMRAGLLISALFPLVGVFVVLYMKRYFKKR